MKIKFTSLLIFAVFNTFSTFAQEGDGSVPLAPKNKTVTTLNDQKEPCRLAVMSLLAAIQSNDRQIIESFFPSRQVYQDMITQFSYTKEEDRATALRNFNQHYQREHDRIIADIDKSRLALQGKQVNATQFEWKITENANFPGGTAALLLEESNGTKHILRCYRFYFFNGKWYLTGKLRFLPA
jgi:hypothetical protein